MIGVSFSFLTLLAVSKAQEEITSATIEAKPIEKSRCGREYFCFRYVLR